MTPEIVDPQKLDSTSQGWDPVWESVFQDRAWGRYPPEELIRFVARNFYSVADRSAVKILELGCGPGANIWFLSREGFEAHGIDGSRTAIEKARGRLAAENLRAELHVGDILRISDLYPANTFDAIIEVACIQHNRIQVTKSVIDLASRLLKSKGRIFSMLIASESWGAETGEELELGTRLNVTVGPAKGLGTCHFFSLQEVLNLFSPLFGNLEIEYSDRSIGGRSHIVRHWIVEGQKAQ